MPRVLRALVVVLGIAGAIAALRAFDVWEHFGVDSMRRLVEAWGPLGPLVFMAIVIAGFFVPGPEMLLVAIGGALFGPGRGFAYAWIASVLGTAATFLLVRYMAQGWAQRALAERFPLLRAFDDRLERHGVVTVVLLRLLLFLAPPLNWALGASRVRFGDYIVGTAIGILPGIGLTVVLADRITKAGSASELLGWDVLGPGLVLAFLVACGVVVGRRLLGGSRRGRKGTRGQPDDRPAGEPRAVERVPHGG